MSPISKICLVGTGLAVLTAGLGFYGISDWDGETGGHWIALVGITFLLPLFAMESFLIAGIIHWCVCTFFVALIWGVVRLGRYAISGVPPEPNPVPVSEPQPSERWEPPTQEEIARALGKRDDNDSSPV